MKVSVTLNKHHEDAIDDLWLAAKRAQEDLPSATTEDLAQLKLRCQIFLDLPLVHALSTDDL
jgi:hypothetical protein